MVHHISKDCIAFIFKGQAVQEEWHFNMKEIWSSAVLGTTRSMTHCHIPEDINPQQYSASLAEGYQRICPHNKILFNIHLTMWTPYGDEIIVQYRSFRFWQWHIMFGTIYQMDFVTLMENNSKDSVKQYVLCTESMRIVSLSCMFISSCRTQPQSLE